MDPKRSVVVAEETLAAALARLRGCEIVKPGTSHFGWPGYLVQGDPAFPNWADSTLTEQGYAAAILDNIEAHRDDRED